jgi:hypothetical protein
MIKYSTRLVFLIGNIVIKIPLSKRGYLQCKNEKKMWDKYKHLNVLGKLYWEWNGIICMKKYKPTNVLINQNEANNFIDTVVGVKHMIPEFDIDKCDLYRAENWGIDGDDYVLIDYGINEEISKLYEVYEK